MPSDAAKTPETIFGYLPPDLFRLFSGGARWFFAELLEHLDVELLAGVGGTVTQREAVAAIAEFVGRSSRAAAIEEDAGAEAQPNASPEQRAAIAYNRLVATGWLVEQRDRYRRLVDMDGHARLLLQLLVDIRRGRTRSYGGEVLQVLTLLEAAKARPADRSEAVRSATRSARSFMNHIRSVSSSMRTAEQAIAREIELAPLFRSYFDDFVSVHLIEDYKRLHTQSNPFRFRVRIVELADTILGDSLLLDELADGYVREGRASGRAAALEVLAEELQQVVRVFGAVDEHLDLIEETNRRLERRIRNTVRHMDRIAESRTERIVEAMRAVAAAGAVNVHATSFGGLRDEVVVGPEHLYQNARRPRPPVRTPIRRPLPDPALLAHQAALRAYRMRMAVGPTRIRAYLEAALDGCESAKAADLPLCTLDDFAVFERLRGLAWIDDGSLAGEFEVEILPGRFENEWIACPEFRVRRRARHEATHG